jgi:hypothetical protein
MCSSCCLIAFADMSSVLQQGCQHLHSTSCTAALQTTWTAQSTNAIRSPQAALNDNTGHIEQACQNRVSPSAAPPICVQHTSVPKSYCYLHSRSASLPGSVRRHQQHCPCV